MEQKAAKARQRESEGRGKKGGGNSPTLTGRALDKVAKVVGRDRKTIIKAKAVVDAAMLERVREGPCDCRCCRLRAWAQELEPWCPGKGWQRYLLPRLTNPFQPNRLVYLLLFFFGKGGKGGKGITESF